jgi:two-component system, OmpR family, sensor histidine kinase KdpD
MDCRRNDAELRGRLLDVHKLALGHVLLRHEARDQCRVQKILDASRISSNGLQAKLKWAEPADFVNAALQRCRNRLASRTVEVTLPEELVLTRIDSVLMERALAQILDNAAKYSPPGSAITVRGQIEDGAFAIAVSDQGGRPRRR